MCKTLYTVRATTKFVSEIFLNFIYLSYIVGSSFIYIEALYTQASSVAVLTGGNRGLGLQILKKLLRCEMTVILGM